MIDSDKKIDNDVTEYRYYREHAYNHFCYNSLSMLMHNDNVQK